MDFKCGLFWIFIGEIFLIPIYCIPEDAPNTTKLIENSKEIELKIPPDTKEPENIILNQSEIVEDIRNEEEITTGEIQTILRESDVANIRNYEKRNDEPVDEPEEQSVQRSEEYKEAEEGGMVISNRIQSNLKYAVEWIESPEEKTIDINDAQSLHITDNPVWIITMTVVGAMFTLSVIGGVLFYRQLMYAFPPRRRS